jgi:hypothetical protein
MEKNMYWNKEYREKLSNEYKTIFKNEKKPKWTVKKIENTTEPIHPAIPFVGENYDKTKLLIYASAENLSLYKKERDGWLDNDKKSIYRRYNNINIKEFFPVLNCGPIECGQLLIVSAYILKYLNITISYKNPHEFLSNIAADNFGKFSKAGNKNNDYAGNINYLKYSFKYIKADLSILKPKIIILPHQIYSFSEVKELIKKYSPSCKCFPIYQMNAHNINKKDRISKYPKRKKENIDPILLEWHEKITDKRIPKNNFLSVYNYLDYIIKKYKK